MVSPIRGHEDDIVLRFGGGIHSRASEEDIDTREAADGQNFVLDVGNREFKSRPVFDKVGQAPNEAEVRGFATHIDSNGNVTFLVQAGNTVYEWDGENFTSKGTVDASARLRGRLDHQWQLADKVIITDLALNEPVLEWDGSTLSTVSFTDENDSGFGDFYAKYCYVANERAVFANVVDGSTSLPHVIVGSKRSDFTQITVSDRPSGALSAEDPFFLVTPDIRPVNGLVEAFNVVAISTQKGSFYKLTGQGADDFAIQDLYPRSGASGDESVAYVGNDVFYGRQGRIESLRDTERSGDTEINDLSFWIADIVEGYTGWTTVYNSRIDRVYMFPQTQNEVWVLQKGMLATELSPWVVWRTEHSLQYNPTAVMNMLDPGDGLEYVFMGDGNGNIYRLEGTGTKDAGEDEVNVRRASRLFSMPLDAQAYDLQGWIKYRKDLDADVSVIIKWSGSALARDSRLLTLGAAPIRYVYGGEQYYNDGNYYGNSFRGRLVNQKWQAVGQSEGLQIELDIQGAEGFAISEVGLRLRAAT